MSSFIVILLYLLAEESYAVVTTTIRLRFDSHSTAVVIRLRKTVGFQSNGIDAKSNHIHTESFNFFISYFFFIVRSISPRISNGSSSHTIMLTWLPRVVFMCSFEELKQCWDDDIQPVRMIRTL